MNDIAIHLAFPEGVLRYDCAGCDQRCCKTKGLAVFPGERAPLLTVHPALELVSDGNSAGIDILATPSSGCWFLEDALCAIVTSPTPAIRPVSCRLFPFNIFGLWKDTLVVAPNALCPFEVVDDGSGISGAEILALLQAYGAAGAPAEQLAPDSADAGRLVLERLIRHAAGASVAEISPLPLLAFQRITADAFAKGDAKGLDDVDTGRIDEVQGHIDESLVRIAEVIAVPMPNDDAFAAIAPLFAAMTPALRLFIYNTLAPPEVSRRLEILALYAAHWQNLRPARKLNAQTLMQLATSLAPQLALLAAWETPWPKRGVKTLGLKKGQPPAATVNLPKPPAQRSLRLLRIATFLTEGAP